MNTAVVHFVTRSNGAYKWLKPGQDRGRYRVSIVQDPAGSLRRHSHNVIDIIYESPEGIRGVTGRSAYCLDPYKEYAEKRANAFNAKQTYEVPEHQRCRLEDM